MRVQGKCIYPEQPVIFSKKKKELPWAGFEPATSCGCFIYQMSYIYTEEAQLAESNPKMLSSVQGNY